MASQSVVSRTAAGSGTTPPSLFSSTAAAAAASSAVSSPAPSAAAAASASASDLSQSLASLASSFAPMASASSMGNTSTPATNSSVGQPIVRTQVPIFACVPASYNITSGTLPYEAVFLIQSGDANNAKVIKNLPSENATGTFSWGVDIPPGTSVTFVVKDSAGAVGYSVPIVVQPSKNLSCLPKESHTGAIVGGVVGGLAALALAGFVLFMVLRKRRLNKAREERRAAGLASDDEDDYIEGNYGEVVKRSVSQRSRGQRSQRSGTTGGGQVSPMVERQAYFDPDELPPNLDRTPSARRTRTRPEAADDVPPVPPLPPSPSPDASERPTHGRSLSGNRQFGTYNLPGLDFSPDSLTTIALNQPKPELPPVYDEAVLGEEAAQRRSPTSERRMGVVGRPPRGSSRSPRAEMTELPR